MLDKAQEIQLKLMFGHPMGKWTRNGYGAARSL